MGPREVKGEKLKLARKIAERHLAEHRKNNPHPEPGREDILAARKMERASGLLYIDCLKFTKQGRW